MPTAGADVTIPAGQRVIVDQAVQVGQLEVEGTLSCDPDGDSSLTAAGIMVMGGAFVCGSQSAPSIHKFTVTVTSLPSDAGADPEQSNGIVVMSGGESGGYVAHPARPPELSSGRPRGRRVNGLRPETGRGGRRRVGLRIDADIDRAARLHALGRTAIISQST